MKSQKKMNIAEQSLAYTLNQSVNHRHSGEGRNPVTDSLDIWSAVQINKKTVGRGSSKKKQAYGIKKLRELILELAVRGKLVPQDINDEPASVLLEKIAEEKKRLVKDEKLKKPKKLPEIANKEMLFELPQGWEWTRLGDVVDIVRGITFPASEKSKELEAGRLACLRTTNVQDKIEWGDLLFIREQFVKRHEQIILKQDIVMSMANSRELVGKVAIVEDEPEIKTTFGGFLGVMRTRMLNPRYLMVLLRTPLNRNLLIDSASQTTNIANISLGKLNPLVLAIPPLTEQHRIAAKIDELMALCDQLEQQQTGNHKAHQTLVETLLHSLTQSDNAEDFQQNWTRIAEHFDTLFTTEHSIDQLKQTILQLAVMGKLVPQNPNDEPASVLLEKIAEEKARLVKVGKIKKQKSLPEIMDNEKLYEVPISWAWVRFDDLALHSEAGWSPKCKPAPRESDNWGVLKVSAVTWGKYNPSENKELPDDLEPRKECEVMPGDFLISRANTAELVARAVVVPEGAPSHLMMSDKIIRFVLSSYVDPELLKLVNGSMVSREYYMRVAGGTSSSMKNVSRGHIRSLVVALPPLAEQHRIVKKVDELMTLCDTLKTRLQQSQTTQVQLADAVVEQAAS